MERRAGFWVRFLAAVIDLGIVLAAVFLVKIVGQRFVVAAPAWLEFDGGPVSRPADFVRALLNSGPIAVVFIPVYGLSEVAFGRTLGKRLLGLVIAKAGDDPAAGVLGARTIRYLVKWGGDLLGLIALMTGVHVLKTAGGIYSLMVGLGFLAAVGKSRQAIHDRIARTSVVPSARAASHVILQAT
jgi:uncharacterized RDD family membrane protein YckC